MVKKTKPAEPKESKPKTGKTVQLENLQIEYVPIDSVIPNEYNPNRQSDHEFNLLKRSISEDGMTQPVIVLPNGRIVDGEHRWKACKALGYTSIPVVKIDMTEEQRRVATLRHNLARGSHDIELEADVLRDLQQLGVLDWAQEQLQLSDVEVERMLNDTTPLDVYGTGEFGEAWDYSKMDPQSADGAPTTASEAARLAAEQSCALQQAGMEAADVKIVRSHITVTQEQDAVVNKALGEKRADTLVALAQAHTAAKDRAGKGDWTPLTFLVPTSALEVIESELSRLQTLAPTVNQNLTPELKRGLALEFMAVNSSQTPEESLK